MYTNADGLLNKKDELQMLIAEYEPSIIAITELKPKRLKYFEQVEYAFPGYVLFTNKDMRLGAGIYIKKSLNPVEYDGLSDIKFEESVWCTFTSKRKENVLLGCIYKSPNSVPQNEEALMEMLRKAGNLNFDKICIVGDFNYPTVDWNGKWTSTRDEQFLESIRDAYLHQMVNKPSRRREGQRPTLDDLILVNDLTLVSDIIHCSPLGKSDHEVLLFKLYVEEDDNKEQEPKFNLSKGDYAGMRTEFGCMDWSMMEGLSVEECWSKIQNSLHQGMDKFIPKSCVKHNNFKPKWLKGEVMKSAKKKYALYKRFLKSKSSYDYAMYIQHRKACKKKVRSVKKDYEKRIIKESKSNPKVFWKYIQSKTKTASGISPLRTNDGKLVDSDMDKAETLNAFFASVFSRENTEDMINLEEACHSEGILLSDIVVTPAAVKDKLSHLDGNKAEGPDGIPPKVLKELSDELAYPIAILFNKSLEKGTLPKIWKNADVVAIFKKGTRSDASNYRPVSLTSVLCKVLESFIRDAIVKHMTDYNLYASCQHGFRNRRSCVTQLLEVMEIITDNCDQGELTDMIYLDFRKAFDSVPHQRLLVKLRAYGITGVVYNWVADFLSNRQQRVRVNKSKSGLVEVLSGIPQGSILGPVLFTLFINDISDNLSSDCRIFADDTKIFNTTNNTNILQDDLNILQEWSKTWKLDFNISKCNVLHIGKRNPQCIYTMNAGGEEKEINSCDKEKDLGVFFDGLLTFDAHVHACIAKANRILGIIKRSFVCLDKDSFTQLYKTLVRPHLEYANVIWAPKFKRQSIAIERVQRRATKIVQEVREFEYERRLKLLNLPTLKYRRFRGDVIQTFKIVNKIDDLNIDDFYSYMNECRTRGGSEKFFINRCFTNTKLHSFSQRSARYWNNLQLNTKNAKDINQFKNLLDSDPHRKIFRYDFDS